MNQKKPLLAHATAPFYVLLSGMGILIFMGLLMVLSASGVRAYANSGSSFAIVFRQFLWFGAGLLLGYVAYRMPTKGWRKLSSVLVIASAIMLLLVFVPGIGLEINGNRNWIPIGPFLIQPSEFAKLAMILFCAFQLNKSERSHRENGKVNPFLAIIPVTIIFIALIILGKDVGTALIFAGIAGSLLILAGIDYKYIVFTVIPAIILFVLLVITQPNRLKRFKALIDPFAPDVYKLAGWQPAHSIMGLASGGLFGVGIGDSKQKWANLAEAHTDFIFSVIGEEMGLFGTLLVIVLYSALIFAIFRTALKSKNTFHKYAVAGIGSWLALQVCTNLATNVGIAPVIGVTLPFISYGGSSVIANLVAIGFVLKVALAQGGVDLESKMKRKIAS